MAFFMSVEGPVPVGAFVLVGSNFPIFLEGFPDPKVFVFLVWKTPWGEHGGRALFIYGTCGGFLCDFRAEDVFLILAELFSIMGDFLRVVGIFVQLR